MGSRTFWYVLKVKLEDTRPSMKHPTKNYLEVALVNENGVYYDPLKTIFFFLEILANVLLEIVLFHSFVASNCSN